MTRICGRGSLDPTLELSVSVDPVGLKKQDDGSGMKLIDPKQ
jgi:hypothetical protein